MKSSSLHLVVLRTANLESLLKFYEAVGLTFVEEKHGNGPKHYACDLGSSVLELYPAYDKVSSGSATMLGFTVNSIENVLSSLNASQTPVKNSSYGRRAVVYDPDGRMVELVEKS